MGEEERGDVRGVLEDYKPDLNRESFPGQRLRGTDVLQCENSESMIHLVHLGCRQDDGSDGLASSGLQTAQSLSLPGVGAVARRKVCR